MRPPSGETQADHGEMSPLSVNCTRSPSGSWTPNRLGPPVRYDVMTSRSRRGPAHAGFRKYGAWLTQGAPVSCQMVAPVRASCSTRFSVGRCMSLLAITLAPRMWTAVYTMGEARRYADAGRLLDRSTEP